MGCQNSKLTTESVAVPPKVRPLLRRQLEEMRRRRSSKAIKGQNLSKKELLKESVHGSGTKRTSSPEESISSVNPHPITEKSQESTTPDESISSPKAEPKPEESITSSIPQPTPKENVAPSQAQPVLEEKSNMKPMVESEKRNEALEDHKIKGNEENLEQSKEGMENKCQETSKEEEIDTNVTEALEKKEVVVEDKTTDREGENEEDDEEPTEEECSGANIGPGSPSFRVYCRQSLRSIQENDSKANESPKSNGLHTKSFSADSAFTAESKMNDSPKERETHAKSLSADSVDMTSVASDEVKVAKSKKKGGKVRSFKRAISKGRPVKNLFKVQSCYHHSKESKHEKATLLSTKSSAV